MSSLEPIARPRVEGQVRAGLDRGPVLLVAPAGWGKTVALDGALRGRPGPVVRYGCTPADADPGRLLVGVLRAVRRSLPGAADVLLEELDGPGEAVGPARVAEALLRELDELLLAPLVLVLDDAERLGADPATAEVLGLLLDADPAVLRLALAGRGRPAAPTARREATGALVVVGRDDLRFDHDECRALLRRRGRRDDDQAVVDALTGTDGWPLGLVLGVEGGADARATIEAFVTEELLDGLPADVRSALLDASVDAAPAPGAAVLRAAPDGLAELAVRRGLATRTGTADGIRWHPLVREALQARWRRERPAAQRAALLARTADALLAAGRAEEAVDRLLAAGRPAAALPAMLAALPRTRRAAPGAVRRWIDALPEDLRTGTDGRWLAGQLAVVEGRMTQAAAWYVAALRGLDRERHDAALLGVVECTYFVGDLGLGASVRHVLETPERLADRPLALLAAAWWGITRAAHGERDAGVGLAERAQATAGGELARQFGPLLDAHHTLVDGGHDALRERLARLEADAAGGDFPEWMASIRGFLETDVGRRDEAVRQAERMIERADRDAGSRHWQTLGSVQLGWALAGAGRWADAAAVLTPLRGAGFDGWPRCWVDAGLALVADADGDRVAARGHAERALRLGAGAPLLLRHLLVLDVVPVLARAGAEDRAAATLEETLRTLDERLGPARGGHPRARLRAQRAWLRARAGDAAGARDDLRAALTAGPDVLRAAWALIGPAAWDLLAAEAGGADARGAGTDAGLAGGAPTDAVVDVAAVVAAVDRAFDGGPELLALAAHPSPVVRAAVAGAAARSAHPAAAERVKALAADADPGVAARAAEVVAGATGAPPPLRVRLLGGFEVHRGPWPVDERAWGRPTAARLVRFLLVHRGAPVPQDRILDALWPGRPPAAAKGQLQVAVSRARAVLDPPGTPPADGALTFRDGAYRLVLRGPDVVDAEAFAAATTAALAASGEHRVAALAHAAALWTGEPLPEERYADWAAAWAEDLRESLHRVLRALAVAQAAAGDEPAVAATARRLLALDPLDEGAHRALMRAHARTGRPALALRQFLACRRALVEGLGVEPAEETTRIQAAVLAGREV